MPKKADPRKRTYTIFWSIVVVLLLLIFFSPIQTQSLSFEEEKEIEIAQGDYFSKEISFETDDQKTINYSVEAESKRSNPRLEPRRIDILFLNEENFLKYRKGYPIEYIEEGSKLNTSTFSTEFEMDDIGNFYIVLDNTNRFTLANQNTRSFTEDRAIVNFELSFESTESIVKFP